MATKLWQREEIRGLENPSIGRASAAAVMHNGLCYIVGGRKSNHFFNDILCMDPIKKTCKPVTVKNSEKFRPRASHTATIISGEIWVVGGTGGKSYVFSEVAVFSIVKGEWRFPELILKSGGEAGCKSHALLQRTAHAAEIHPCSPTSILVMGGYGNPSLGDIEPNVSCVFLNDVFVIDTVELTVELISASGQKPQCRGYHSMTLGPQGKHLYVIGGRTDAGMMEGRQSLFVLTVEPQAYNKSYAYSWLTPSLEEGASLFPPRSSHRAVAVGDRIVVYGGANNVESDKPRLNDVISLILNPSLSKLEWSLCDQPSSPGHDAVKGTMLGRSAHLLLALNSTIYALLGYAVELKSKEDDKGILSDISRKIYVTDCWSLVLSPTARAASSGLSVLSRKAANEDVPFITKTSTKVSGDGMGAQQDKVKASLPVAVSPPPRSQGAQEGMVGGRDEEEAGVKREAKRPRIEQQQQQPGPGPLLQASMPLRGSESQPPLLVPASTQGRIELNGGGTLGLGRQAPTFLDQQQDLYRNYKLLEVELKHLREQRDGLLVQVRALAQAKEEKEKLAIESQQLLLKAQSELEKTVAKLRQSESDASVAEGVHVRVSSELRSARQDLAKMQRDLCQMEAKLESSERELETERRRGTSLDESVARLSSSLEQLHSRLRSEENALSAERAAAAAHHESHRAAMREQESALESARQELRAVQGRLIGSDQQVSQLRSEASSLMQRARVAEEAAAKAEEERKRLEVEYAQLKDRVAKMREVGESVGDFFRSIEQVVERGRGPMARLKEMERERD